MKKLIVITLLLILGFYLMSTFISVPFGAERIAGVKDYYLKQSPETLKVSNVVTAIVVSFRGFDTLGEVTVLFLASTALGSILYRRRTHHSGLNPQREAVVSSTLVRTGAKVLFPMIILLGAYVFVHGHLTPGGGFQGGAIIATGFLLILISYRKFFINHNVLTWVEALAGTTFVLIGIGGFIFANQNNFLENFLPEGTLNNLISGGVVGIIYIAVGFKVGAEITGILDTLLTIKEAGLNPDEN
ncbi:MAG: cation:proton antiporter [Chlorobi bacterium]|nr:cation:proton antiporter [Chlorobiota bacterium]